MKKRIVFVMRNMGYAGAEIVLINLLNNIDCDKYDVYLFTQKNDNIILKHLKKDIKIIYQENINSKKILINDIIHFRIIKISKGLFYRIALRVTKDKFRREVYATRTHKIFECQFDMAIAFKPADIPFVLEEFDKSINACWIHTYKIEGEPFSITPYVIKRMEQFDKIFCVSNDIKKKIDSFSNILAQKTEVFFNIQDVSAIQKKAHEHIYAFSFDCINIVTVSRISKEKGLERIVPVMEKLIKDKYSVHWYIIGDGLEYNNLKKQISESKVEFYITLLGFVENPYPYIKNCDIYVQTSYVEGYCTATLEAKILNKPVVTTNAPGMNDQFVSGVNGIVVESSAEGIVSGIKILLDHPEKRETIIKNLKNEDNSNYWELMKLYKLIEQGKNE